MVQQCVDWSSVVRGFAAVSRAVLGGALLEAEQLPASEHGFREA